MNTNEAMTQEQLNAIQERVNVTRARVNAMTVNDSWWSYPWPDPTDERIKELEKENAELRKRLTVDEAMVERAAKALFLSSSRTNTESKWERFPEVIRESWRMDARDVLNAALNPGEGS